MTLATPHATRLIIILCLLLAMMAGMSDAGAADGDPPSGHSNRAPALVESNATATFSSLPEIDPASIPQPGELDTTQPTASDAPMVQLADGAAIGNEVVVLYRDAESFRAEDDQRSIGQVVSENPLINMRILRVGNAEAVIRALRNNPNVEYVGPNYVSSGAYDPNDPIYQNASASWHLREWGFARGTNVRAAWNTQAGDPNARIVIVDTGLDASHPDLRGRVLHGYNFQENNFNWSDCNGHGTAVAGLAGAITNNNLGIAGVDMRAGIYVARVNVGCTGNWSNAAMANAIATASAWSGTRVINISGGGTFNDPAVARAVALARSRNVVIVAAAGNNSSSTPFFPAALDGVLAVGATTTTGARASFSNWGSFNLSVAAPGEGLCTATLVSAGSYSCGWNGTSFASPVVAGIVMLVRAQYPAINEVTARAQVEWASFNPERGCWNCYSNNYGFGIVQAYAAVTSQR